MSSGTALVKADVKGVAQQVQEIQLLMSEVMKEGEHYGTIPGCGDKKTLLKSGAEKLGLLFHIAPEYKIEKTELPNGHREYLIVCRLANRSTGEFLGEGVGICSTMEKKYRYRSAKRKCPKCSTENIYRSKYGDKGWYCHAKQGGCGEQFPHDAPEIVGQGEGNRDNPDIADTFNTVLKIGKKRALVDATLTATAASDIFTQDLEDIHTEPEQVIEAEIVEESVKQGSEIIQNEAMNTQLTKMILDLIKWYGDKDFLNTLSVAKRQNYQKVLSDVEGKTVMNRDDISIENLPSILHIPSVKTWHAGIGKMYDTYDLTKGATDGE